MHEKQRKKISHPSQPRLQNSSGFSALVFSWATLLWQFVLWLGHVSWKAVGRQVEKSDKSLRGRRAHGKRSVRHAEKSRTATCAFADTVASKCVELYRTLRDRLSIEHRRDFGRGQTVIACVLEKWPCVQIRTTQHYVDHTHTHVLRLTRVHIGIS